MLQTEDGMRLILLHYHILKNGGSSIIEILRRSFWDAFCEHDLPDSDAEIKPRDMLSFLERNPGLRAVSSHQIFYPVPQAAGFLFFDICFLRDPIDRIRSTYDYFRVKPAKNTSFSDLANQHTLADFTRFLVEQMPWTVNNVQVNLLANGLVHDPPRGLEDLEVATARMLETSFLGVVDCFDESLVAGRHRLRIVFPNLNCVQPPVNDSAAPGTTLEQRIEQFRKACDPDVFAELVRLNDMDLELLRRARAEVHRRFDRVPDGKARLWGLKEAVSRLQAGGGNTNELIPETPATGKRKIKWIARKTPPPGLLTRVIRRLRFVTNPRMMRSASAFRLLFDAKYYRETYPDVAASGDDPLWHFVTTGAFEGRNPHPLFDTNFYLSQCHQPPSANALTDYLDHGDDRDLRPHPLFDSVYYLRQYPEVRKAGMNSLFHYVLHGAAEGRKPHPLFQPDYYVTVCAAARDARNSLVHFVESQSCECSTPHPLFDGESYLRAHPGVAENPLMHYLTHHANSQPQSAANPGDFDIASFSIQDVELTVAFADSGLPAGRDDFSAEIALVRRDASGAKQFLCPPQQQPFFECLRYDQLAAQLNRQGANP